MFLYSTEEMAIFILCKDDLWRLVVITTDYLCLKKLLLSCKSAECSVSELHLNVYASLLLLQLGIGKPIYWIDQLEKNPSIMTIKIIFTYLRLVPLFLEHLGIHAYLRVEMTVWNYGISCVKEWEKSSMK